MAGTPTNRLLLGQVPVRLDFGGGPSDVPPFRHHTQGSVVNATIGLYAYAELEVYGRSRGIVIRSDDYATVEEFSRMADVDVAGPLSLLKAVVVHRNPQFGFRLRTWVDVPPGCGLGSSAALTIAVLRVLDYATDGAEPVNKFETLVSIV